MIVFNLACEHNHAFDGWFGSAADFDDQSARGLLVCPVCESRRVEKRLSAPRLNLRGGTDTAAAPAPSAPADKTPALAGELHKAWLEMSRRIVANTEDVGERFASEARRIHYNEAPDRNIRGIATPEQARELRDEGIEVQAFPLAAAAKSTLQ